MFPVKSSLGICRPQRLYYSVSQAYEFALVSEGLASLWSTLFPCYLQFLTCKTSTASPVSQVFVHQFLFSFMHSPSLLFSFHHLCSVISLNYICLYSPSIQKHPSPLLFINHQSVCCSPLFFCSSHHPSILYFCPFVFFLLSIVLTAYHQTTEDTVVVPLVTTPVSLGIYVASLFQPSQVTAALQLVLSAIADVTLSSPFTLSLPLL